MTRQKPHLQLQTDVQTSRLPTLNCLICSFSPFRSDLFDYFTSFILRNNKCEMTNVKFVTDYGDTAWKKYNFTHGLTEPSCRPPAYLDWFYPAMCRSDISFHRAGSLSLSLDFKVLNILIVPQLAVIKHSCEELAALPLFLHIFCEQLDTRFNAGQRALRLQNAGNWC